MAYLDGNGLSYFWNKIKTFVGSKIVNSMSSNEPTTTAPSITAIKNYVDSADTKVFKTSWANSNSNTTNTTTSWKEFGTTLSITTTGKPIVVIASNVGYVNAGNVTYGVNLNGTWKQYGSTSATSRERTTGFVIFENVPAGTYTVKMGFVCTQSSRTATIPAYVSNALLAFEI